MLEKMPHIIGSALRGFRHSLDETVYCSKDFLSVPETITLSSTAFENETTLPSLYTEDGMKISPPLRWRNIPPEAKSLALLIEDPDAPLPSSVTHALVFDMPPQEGELVTSALPSPGDIGMGTWRLGKNSFNKPQYLPPDPPPGHGPHKYVFQLYALDYMTGMDEDNTREDLVEAMKDHVIAKGCLIGIYERV